MYGINVQSADSHGGSNGCQLQGPSVRFATETAAQNEVDRRNAYFGDGFAADERQQLSPDAGDICSRAVCKI